MKKIGILENAGLPTLFSLVERINGMGVADVSA